MPRFRTRPTSKSPRQSQPMAVAAEAYANQFNGGRYLACGAYGGNNTLIIPANCTKIRVYGCAGGGGGAGCNVDYGAAGNFASGAGGGSGGFGIGEFAVVPGQSYPIIIGAGGAGGLGGGISGGNISGGPGGTTSLGSLISFTGGRWRPLEFRDRVGGWRTRARLWRHDPRVVGQLRLGRPGRQHVAGVPREWWPRSMGRRRPCRLRRRRGGGWLRRRRWRRLQRSKHLRRQRGVYGASGILIVELWTA